MKVTLDWLRDYVEIDLEAEALAERLTLAGLETEGIEVVDGETVIELETTSNRPDHLGALGVAREISWICERPLRTPDLSYETVPDVDGKPISDLVTIDVQDLERCPRYIARLAVDVKVGPSSDWLRRRVEAIGLRSVNNVVDLSNYVLFEYGQPLHAFDFDRLTAGTIIVRRASQSEQFTAINGKEYALDREDLVIADTSRPVALAGIMGGLDSEVGGGTSRVLLESAWFRPVPVRRTSRRLTLASDSSYRFERRVDPLGVEYASRRFLHLLQKETGARIVEGAVEACDSSLIDDARRTVSLRPSRVTQVLGVDISPAEIRGGLGTLGFEETGGDDQKIEFRTPSFRVDVHREIDLVEEVARVYGFDRIPDGELRVMPVVERRESRLKRQLESLLIGAGYHEALTLAFTTAEDAEIEDWWAGTEPFEVRNPVRSPERRLRRSLLPRLWEGIRGNRLHGVDEVRLFEQARVFHRRPGVVAPVEREHLAWCAVGDGLDFRSVRGVAESVLGMLHIDGAVWVPIEGAAGGLEAGRAAQLDLDGEPIGLIGAASLPGVRGEVWCGELHLDPLLEAARTDLPYAEFSRQPGMRRDLNLIVDESVLWRDLAATVEELALAHLSGLEFVDVYRGKQVPKGRKSVLLALSFQAADRTLTGEEVDAEVERLLARMRDRYSAELRA